MDMDSSYLIHCAHVQQTAAFLLWYHALEGGEEKVAEMASNNIINVCLTIMDSMDASPVDKNCTAGMHSGHDMQCALLDN